MANLGSGYFTGGSSNPIGGGYSTDSSSYFTGGSSGISGKTALKAGGLTFDLIQDMLQNNARNQMASVQSKYYGTIAKDLRQGAEQVEDDYNRMADSQEEYSAEQSHNLRESDKLRMRQQEGVLATTGLSMTEGTIAQVEEQNEYNSIQNAYAIFHQGQEQASQSRYQGQVKKRDLLYQADVKDYEGEMAKYSAKMAERNSMTGILKRGANAGWKWYTMGLG